MTTRPGQRGEPRLTWAPGDAVGFLDAPGVDAAVLLATIDDVLVGMAPGAILAVYSDDPAAAATTGEWCGEHRAELLAIIPHDDAGTTLTLRRTAGPR
jgi:TusA-related sulfurtransferase